MFTVRTLGRGRVARRRGALAAACVGAMLVLTACIDINADVTVNPDATGTGTFEMVLQKEAAGMLGVKSADDFAKQVNSDGSTDMQGMTDCKTGETDAGYTYACSFTNLAFTGSEAPWTISKSGDDLVFAMKGTGMGDAGGASPSASSSDDLSGLLGGASLGTMTVNVSFPGPILATTGSGVTKTSDTTATITADLGKSVDATITAAASGGGLSGSVIAVVLVAAAVIALIIIVAIVLITRRRKPSAAPALTAPEAPDGDADETPPTT